MAIVKLCRALAPARGAVLVKSFGYAELHTILAKLLLHFDISIALRGRDVEWVMQKSYTMMEKQLFDVQLAYIGGKLS